mgnify:FL=1
MKPTIAILAALLAAAPAGAADYKHSETLLETDRTVVGETLAYPGGAPAEVTAQVVVIQPGEATVWHKHPVPLYAYMLEGELTVDYGPHGPRTYRAGDNFMEAMDVWHQGRNTGATPVRILAVSMGAPGLPLVEKKPD